MQLRGALALAGGAGCAALLLLALTAAPGRVALATISIPSPSDLAEQVPGEAVWGYGDEKWASMEPKVWGACAGKKQSPINIERAYWAAFWASGWSKKYLEKPQLAPLVWNVDKGTEHTHHLTKAFSYDGRAVEVPYKGNMISMRGGEKDRNFYLKSIVLHTPSEHTFDGKHYPMEAQFIHRRGPSERPDVIREWWEGPPSEEEDGPEEFLVVSAFFSRALSSSSFADKIGEAARQAKDEAGKKGENDPLSMAVSDVSFPDMASEVLMQVEMPLEVGGQMAHTDHAPVPVVTLDERAEDYDRKEASLPNYQAYYSYPGSLTRPPCSEDVTYILLKHSLPIADADLDAIKALQGDNAREPQALHKRLVADSNA